MTDGDQRLGAARDVPPPRPVAPAIAEETGLGRAARAVAEAVAGLVGSRPDPGGERTATGPSSAASGLRDVVGAVAGAVGAAFRKEATDDASARPGSSSASGASGDRSPTAMLGDLLAAAAPRLPIRDAAGLRRAYPGATDDEIADALALRAAKLTTGIGAATGGLAAAHWLATPSLLALPLELGAETALVAAVELVLVGELHELYGRRPPGDARDRAATYLASWSARNAADRTGAAGIGSLSVLGLRALHRRLTRRLAGSVPAAAPFLIGAALVGRGNRRATEILAARLRADLRGAWRPGTPGAPG
jgi:hypothetical protein